MSTSNSGHGPNLVEALRRYDERVRRLRAEPVLPAAHGGYPGEVVVRRERDAHDHACCPPDDCCGGPCAAHPCWDLVS